MILRQTWVVTFVFASHSNHFTPLTELILSSVIEPRKSSSLSSLTSELILPTFALCPIFEYCLQRTLIAGQSFLLWTGNFLNCMHFFSVLFLLEYLLFEFLFTLFICTSVSALEKIAFVCCLEISWALPICRLLSRVSCLSDCSFSLIQSSLIRTTTWSQISLYRSWPKLHFFC